MKDSIDRPQGARRRGSRRAALRGPVFLLALLGSAAIAAATTSAQEGTPCDPAAPAGAPNACPKQLPPPAEAPSEEEPPPEEPPPPEDPPPKPPQPQAPAPQAPAARAVCPDGTWAPCPEPSQQAEEPEESTQPRRRRDCRKRPGVRRPKYCPKLRRQRSGKQGDDKKSPRERRRAARRRARKRAELRAQERAEERKACQQARGSQLMPMDTLRRCPQGITIDELYIAGRLPSRPLPDPLPPGSRLDDSFARLLERVAGKRWPLVLAMLREQGKTGAAPAEAAELGELAEQAGGGQADERVTALADYHRAVGLAGLTRGLHAVKGELIRRVLGSGKVNIYPGGRFDVSSGRIDVRVHVTMLYLAERHGGITVTSLMSGHGVFTKSGGVSLHSYGQAMDIAAIGGVSVLGNQQPGGPTEAALRSVMLLPPELQPSELISLFKLGGPSFAMADHADHVHVGF